MEVLADLLQTEEPLIRRKALLRLTGKKPDSTDVQAVTNEARVSTLVRTLLSEQDETGEIFLHPYQKWRGAHWVLACLADLEYPPGDERLRPLLEQVYGWLLSAHHLKSVKVLAGRARRCASQEGNALYASLALGLADDRSQELAQRLMRWQWPDGGWNCDKNPAADTSSFMESLIPLRALALYARRSGDPQARQACQVAAEVFLQRQMYLRQRDGAVINQDFICLHYPCYWHYDILFGLKVMAEAGFIEDPRCRPTLDLLESKRLAGGGFPSEGKYYRTSEKVKSGRSLVNWDGYRLASNHRASIFVTLDALFVLQRAGRITI